ncbi:MAG: Gfo/Idh/MocA family oxidoreductase [Clostridiales bacterium]|nr:Gfo/Idh/MocA family oxidoreductase [Clostridiales bacterium]
MFNVGIIGCGTMSARMADALKGNPDICIAGVASRDRNKGKKFAKAHCPDAKVYTGYEKLAAAKDIDLIYIATPNTCHYENAITCIKEHKNVLIEKPFAMSNAETDSIFTEAKNRGIFVCEGMWPNFMPLHKKIGEWIADGKIGAVKYISANLGYDLTEVKRLYDPVLGGGAYLDLGVYTTNLALSFMGDNLNVTRVFARRLSTGCDRDTTYILETEGGEAMANLYVTMDANTDKNGAVVGEKGKIVITNINNYRRIELLDGNDELIEAADAEGEFYAGLVYEMEACKKAIEKGRIQCPEMPWQRTSKIAQINDTVRSMM